MADLLAEVVRERDLLLKKRQEVAAHLDVIERRLKDLDTFLKVADDITADSMIAELVQMPTTFKGAVEAIAKELLAGASMRTRDIVGELAKRGVAVPGKNEQDKIMRVSQILHKSGLFDSDRTKGWSLKAGDSQPPKDKAQGVGAPRAFELTKYI